MGRMKPIVILIMEVTKDQREPQAIISRKSKIFYPEHYVLNQIVESLVIYDLNYKLFLETTMLTYWVIKKHVIDNVRLNLNQSAEVMEIRIPLDAFLNKQLVW